MTYRTIDFAQQGGIARLTLNRPDRLNSFTVEMHEEVADALGRLDGARVLVLTGAGRGFCAGQDLADRAVAPGEAVDLGESVEQRYNPLIRRLTALPLPVRSEERRVGKECRYWRDWSSDVCSSDLRCTRKSPTLSDAWTARESSS